MKFEEYIEYLKNGKEDYKWPLEKLDERLVERKKVHKEMPYIVTVASDYYHLDDDVDPVLRDTFGPKHGECGWRECEFSYDTWHKETGLEAELQNKLYPRVKGEEEARTDHIKEHFAMIEKRIDKPGKHCHKGKWTTFWIVKTGYDYGYQDFCFKYEVDWLKFLFMNISFNGIESHIAKENDDENGTF